MFVLRKITACLLAPLIFATACTATKVPPPEISKVDAGDPKYRLYALIGEPDDQLDYADGRLEYFTYVYTEGSCKKEVSGNSNANVPNDLIIIDAIADDPLIIIFLPVVLPIAMLGVAAGDAIADSVSSHLNCDTVDAALIVDETTDGAIRDAVLVVEKRPGVASKMVDRLRDLTGAPEEERENVWDTARQAALGDAEAQYAFAGYLSQPSSRMVWLERAVAQRHSEAAQELLLTTNELAVPLCADRTDFVTALDWLLTTDVLLRQEDIDGSSHGQPRWLAANNRFWLDRCRAEMATEQIETARRAAALRLSRFGVDDVGEELQALLRSDRSARDGNHAGAVFKDCDVCPEMVVVPPGRYQEKPSSARGLSQADDRQPFVAIDGPFAVGVYEVTFAEWDACVADGGCAGYAPEDEGWGRDRRPVINVSWEDAQSYLAWLNDRTGKTYRLLTGDEWAYVARAGTTTAFPFGQAISTDDANYLESGLAQTLPVGSFQPNWFGLYDTVGNVREWLDYCRTIRVDNDSGQKVRRLFCQKQAQLGGSWMDDESALWVYPIRREIFRVRRFRYDHAGFRVARDLQ